MEAFCGFRIGDRSATNVACRGAKWKVLSGPAIVCIRSSISTDAEIIRLEYVLLDTYLANAQVIFWYPDFLPFGNTLMLSK